MDPDFLRNLDYYSGQAQTRQASHNQGESSAAGASRDANDIAFWDALAARDLTTASNSNTPFNQPSSSTANLSYRPSNSQQQHQQPSASHGAQRRHVSQRPSGPGAMSPPRKRDGHDKKRARLDGESAALESVDSWLQFDDDDGENPFTSFEIDFSKRQNSSSSFPRPASRLNPLPATPGLGTGLYAHPTFKEEDFEIDDAALDNALSEDDDFLESMNLGDQLSNIDTQPPSEVPPREGLYSTPLSWEKPAPGLRMNPLLGIGTPLLDPEQRRLLAIALNTSGSSTSGFGMAGGEMDSEYSSMGHLGSSAATASLSEISKGPEDEAPRFKGKEKEESTTPGAGDKTKGHKPQGSKANASLQDKGKEKMKLGDRTAHNDIERKYRTNLKDKISELRDAVPSLRSMPEEGDEECEGEGQSRGGPKVSKGTVLLKATEYIHHLEKRNKAIMKEHQDLARRLQAFEQLLTATARQPFPMPTYSRTLFDPRGFC